MLGNTAYLLVELQVSWQEPVLVPGADVLEFAVYPSSCSANANNVGNGIGCCVARLELS